MSAPETKLSQGDLVVSYPCGCSVQFERDDNFKTFRTAYCSTHFELWRRAAPEAAQIRTTACEHRDTWLQQDRGTGGR